MKPGASDQNKPTNPVSKSSSCVMRVPRILGSCLLAALFGAIAGGQPPQSPAPPQSVTPPRKPAPPAPTPESIARAEQVLTEARKALGGDKLAAIKTLVASGRTRRVRGNNLVPIEFEILLELPDKYLRVDEFPAEDTDPTSSGFNGDALIQIPPLPAGPPGGRGPMPGAPGAAPPTATPPGGMARGGPGPAPDPRRARVTAVKQDFARFGLGLFAAQSSTYPLTFSYAAVAEAPQGRADVLDVRGEGNFALRFFIHSETRLPVMVSWTTPPTNVVVTVEGQPPPKTVAPGAVVVTGPPAPAANAPKEEMDKYTKDVLALRTKAQATPVEHRLYYAEYRDVDGVRLPFRLRRAIGAETTEETTFDQFRINTRIDPRKFDPAR
jgi:hypothetical protein